MPKIRVNIDGKELLAHDGYTILEVARQYDIDIPTLCQDDKLEHYGSCGMCVVEVEGSPRLFRACSTNIQDGMIIKTYSDRIRESRKTTLELLLSNHRGDCKAPCSLGCPGKVDVQGYVGLIANKAYDEAIKLIKEELPLPASIGRVCPHPCQTACRRGLVEDSINIAWLKQFAADLDLAKEAPFIPELAPSTGKKVAVIGGGPSGLANAYYLRKLGHDVVIYEAMPKFGGMLEYGIPIYRLPKDVLKSEVDLIEKMGVKLLPNTRIGEDISLEHIRKEFDAVYVAIGAWKSAMLRVPGNDLSGVYGGIEFLNKFAVNHPIKVGERIAVIGGGNTAMDACRTAIRLGAKEVYAIYRRTKDDMPAVDVEIEEAEEEGVVFKFLKNPLEVIGDENRNVKAIRLQKMQQGEKDASGRSSVTAVEGVEEILDVDSVIVSIGQKLSPEGFEDIIVNRWGNIDSEESTYLTNLEGVFAGGDCTNDGASIAIEAINEGKCAARVIDSYLNGKIIPQVEPFVVKQKDVTAETLNHIEKMPAVHMRHEHPELRKTNFEEIVYGYSEDEAKCEAMRCLECGCGDVHECDLIKQSNDYAVQPDRIIHEQPSLDKDNSHPFIMKDQNKCILCGMCVRICDEVMDNTALGLVGRGFETSVQPSFGELLKDTDCVSCGQCITVCPTGALQEKLMIDKAVPLKPQLTETVCSHCNVGCRIELETKGDLLLRALPVDNDISSEGLLCAKGRFGFDVLQKDTRIRKPMIRKDGVLQEVDYKEAFQFIAKKAQSLSLIYGNDSIGVSVSDRYTNEDLFIVKKFANERLSTRHVYSFNSKNSGLKSVIGMNASTNVLNELYQTPFILTVDSAVMEDHTVAGLKIRKAIRDGSQLYTIGTRETKISEWAHKNVLLEEGQLTEALRGVVKALFEMGCPVDDSRLEGVEALRKFVSDAVLNDALIETAKAYKEARKAMIVFDQDSISEMDSALVAAMAVLSGHIGSPRDGIIQLRSNANAQGLIDLGIQPECGHLIQGIDSQEIKGLMVFGENIDPDIIGELDFLMVQDTHLTQIAEQADVVLPAAILSESSGTVTSCDRRIQAVNKAVHSVAEYENWEMIQALMNVFDGHSTYTCAGEIFEDIEKVLPDYLGWSQNENMDYWPINDTRVLYQNAFRTPSGKAQLQNVETVIGCLIRPFVGGQKNSNHITTCFQSYVKEATN